MNADDLKVQKVWRKRFQVLGARKELKHLFQFAGDKLFMHQAVGIVCHSWLRAQLSIRRPDSGL